MKNEISLFNGLSKKKGLSNEARKQLGKLEDDIRNHFQGDDLVLAKMIVEYLSESFFEIKCPLKKLNLLIGLNTLLWKMSTSTTMFISKDNEGKSIVQLMIQNLEGDK